MQTDFYPDTLNKVSFLLGDTDSIHRMLSVPTRTPFDDEIIELCNDLSRAIMKSSQAKSYSDLITFAFWIRRASVRKMEERFKKHDNTVQFGRGIVFHVAPSNVPVNFAYSMMAGLLCGNINIVRVPGKDYEQVSILVDLLQVVLEQHEAMKPYICLVRYGHEREVNDLFSSIADVRVVWGGNSTITELRKSPLPPRASEITFADRYSLAVIDSDMYLETADKKLVAEHFYNDTFFSDQNACTSPRLIVWIGNHNEEAKKVFWEMEYSVVEQKYSFQPIQGINKLTTFNLVAATEPNVKLLKREDNLIFRVHVSKIAEYLIDYRENSGFFYEYDCKDIRELEPICNDKRCQTIAYIGDKTMFAPLIRMGIKGVDRIVPIGRTMDFDLIWDGYDLPALMTRIITVEE